MFLFALAARWPDDIRRTKQHRSAWHYINIPFKPNDQPNSVTAKPHANPNILFAFAENMEQIKAKETTDGDKAVALCWVFHVVGDVHQPLHTSALFTSELPNGDRGGNLLWVRPKERGAIVNLHSYWDGLVLAGNQFEDAQKLASELLARPEFARNKLTELADDNLRMGEGVFQTGKSVTHIAMERSSGRSIVTRRP